VAFSCIYYFNDHQEECWFCLLTFWRDPFCNKCSAVLARTMVCWEDDHCELHGTFHRLYSSILFFEYPQNWWTS